MSSLDTATRQKAVSRWLRNSGLVLWVLVFVAAFVFWRSSRDPGEPSPTASSLPAEDDAFKPIPETEAVDGHEKADTKLDSQGWPLPAWDPKGLPDFSFTERSGRTVTKADLLGKPWAACFIFTRCAGPCPQVTGQMRLLQDRLRGVEARLVTFTVDPEHDTPELLTKWADQFDADREKWLFLTGDKNAIYRLIIDGFRMRVEEKFGADRKPGWEFLHTTNVMLVNAEGRVVNKYNAQFDEEMSALFKAIKQESQSAGK